MSNGLLFPDDELVTWRREWQNMPEYEHENLDFRFQLLVNFACAADLEDFARAIGQTIAPRNGRVLPSVWYPDQERIAVVNLRYVDVRT